MKTLLAIACCFCLGNPAHAQNTSFDAVKISELVISNSWENVSTALVALFQKLESDLVAKGTPERAAKVLAEEARRSLTQDNMSRATAQLISEKMTPEEQKETLAFLQSNSGRKFLILSKPDDTDRRFVASMLKQACDAANRQLNDAERGSIKGACSPFQ